MSFVPADYWPPGPPTGGAATDQAARDAAAAAQSTANAAVSTGAEFDALLKGDAAATAALDYRSPLSLKDQRCGAKGDGVKVIGGGAMSSSANTTTLTLNAGAPGYVALTAGDVGKKIAVKGAATGGVWALTGAISSVTSATVAVISAACTNTVAAADVYYATDDTAAFVAAKNILAGRGGTLEIPPVTGFYWIDKVIIDNTWSNITIRGRGKPRVFSVNGSWAMFTYDAVQEYNQTGAALVGTGVRGRFAVTLASGSDPLRPIAGQLVCLMTYTRATTAQVPIGEWNIVESVSGTTVNLRYPLRHTYRPAYRADQIPYQIVAIANRPVHFGMEGVILEQWTNLPYEIHGLDIWFNGEFESLGCPAFRGRFIKFDYYGRMVVDWFVAGPPAHGRRAYGYVVDTTSTDVAGRCRVSSNGHIITHLHEGQTNVNIECDFACAENDSLAASWGGVSCGENIQDVDITVRYHNCPGNFGYVNVGGNDEQNPSAARTRVRIQTSGKTPGPAFRNLANASAIQPGTPLLLDAQGGGRGSPFFTDVGLGYARQLMPLPVDLADFTAITLPAVAATTPEGDAVVDFPDSGTGIVVWQLDLTQEYVNRRRVNILTEWENTTDGDGTAANSGTRIDIFFGQNTAGTGVPFSASLTRFPNVWKAGSFVYASGTFAVDPTKLRCGVMLERLGQAASDHFTGVMRLRRVKVDFYDPWNG